MNNVSNAISFKNQQPIEMVKRNNVYNINYKASGNDEYVRQNRAPMQSQLPIYDQRVAQVKAYEEARKKQRKQNMKQNVTWGLGIAVSLAFLAVLLPQVFGKGPKVPGGFSMGNMKFQNFTNDASIADLRTTKTLAPKVREFFIDMLESANIDPKYIKRAGLSYKAFPNAGLLLGPSGAGKTEVVKMHAKARDAEMLVIKLGDFANSYVDGTATNMTKMFNDLKKMFDANPNKRYVILFDEADGIAKKLGDITADKDYLNKNRQAFLTGLDIIMPAKNLEVFAATNVPLNQMDEAVISRFGKNVQFELPNTEQLIEGLKFHLKDCEGLVDGTFDFFKDKADEIKAFAEKMVGKKYSFRDLQKMTTDAQAIYAREMNAQKKDLNFGVEYLIKAMESKGLNSAEVAGASGGVDEGVLSQLLGQMNAAGSGSKKKGFWARLFGSKN